MKLIIENWRQYLVESEQVSHCGDLYLFEGDTVTKTSFYDALNTLSESDNDVDTFLENWERSVDYQLENLNEQEIDPLLKVSTQAWMLQNKLKEKAAGKVLAVSKKINDFAEKNPKTVKVAKVVVGGLFAAAAVYGISQILQSGGDASDVMELAQSIQPEDPSLAQDLAECAQEFNPQKIAEFAQEQQEVVEKVADTLSTTNNPALDQMGQVADNVAQDIPEPIDWNSMFEEAAQEKASAEVKSGLDDWSEMFDRAAQEIENNPDTEWQPSVDPVNNPKDAIGEWEELIAQDMGVDLGKQSKTKKNIFKKIINKIFKKKASKLKANQGISGDEWAKEFELAARELESKTSAEEFIPDMTDWED